MPPPVAKSRRTGDPASVSDQLRLQLQLALGAGYTLELTMNVLIMGATGMVGQGVLRECLRAGDVQRVITLGRTATGQFAREAA